MNQKKAEKQTPLSRRKQKHQLWVSQHKERTPKEQIPSASSIVKQPIKPTLDRMLNEYNETYCEILRPTYSFHFIGYFLSILIILLILTPIVAGLKQFDEIAILFTFVFFIWFIICFMLLLAHKHFKICLNQSYYQPIVLNRKQQKIYLYINDSLNNRYEIVELNMADLMAHITVNSDLQRSHYNRNKSLEHLCVYISLVVTDKNKNQYPLFQVYSHHCLRSNVSAISKELEQEYSDQLLSYWNWCRAYMHDQQSEFIEATPIIKRRYFRAHWPEDLWSKMIANK